MLASGGVNAYMYRYTHSLSLLPIYLCEALLANILCLKQWVYLFLKIYFDVN